MNREFFPKHASIKVEFQNDVIILGDLNIKPANISYDFQRSINKTAIKILNSNAIKCNILLSKD